MANATLSYDPTDKDSIESYASHLLNRSLRDLVRPEDLKTYKGKGGFGQLVESAYFHYTPNSNSEPDFPEAGVELKTTPLKKTQKGLTSKERLVLNIIDFDKEHAYTFEQSSFWRKNKLILLMMYLYEKDKDVLDYVFKHIGLWNFPPEDLKIIKDDWLKIVGKIKAGKAHELSEGDTLYLGACTKGANKESLRRQPFSTVMAMQRAYSLKSKYMNFIFANAALKRTAEPIIKDLAVLKKETFEEYVIGRLHSSYGRTVAQLQHSLGLKDSAAKHRLYVLTMALLGVKKERAEEFEKAGIEVKTIKLEESGSPKESMSFGQIKFEEIVEEVWEHSYWHEMVNKRFLFVVFQWQGEELVLRKAFFWNMPYQDVLAAEKFWAHTKDRIAADDFDGFYRMKEDRIFHVRPKGKNSKDLMRAPSGRMEKKKAYWLNGSYIKRIIEQN